MAVLGVGQRVAEHDMRFERRGKGGKARQEVLKAWKRVERMVVFKVCLL